MTHIFSNQSQRGWLVRGVCVYSKNKIQNLISAGMHPTCIITAGLLYIEWTVDVITSKWAIVRKDSTHSWSFIAPSPSTSVPVYPLDQVSNWSFRFRTCFHAAFSKGKHQNCSATSANLHMWAINVSPWNWILEKCSHFTVKRWRVMM